MTQEQNPNQAKKPIYGIIDEVYHTILDRKLNADPQTSYVASLFKKGENAILKKVGEEATELVMACKDASARKNETAQFNSAAIGGQISSNLTQNENFAKISNENAANQNRQTEMSQNQKPKTPTEEIIYEAADLCFHSLVALALHGVHPDRVKAELARRFGLSGIEEKNSRKG